MMNASPGDRRFLAEINVVPLVDVVLVLLIIFMVTAPLLYRGIDIDLPKSDTNTIEPQERVVITVERNGDIYVNKESVPIEKLGGQLKKIKDQDPRVTIYLRADQQVSYGVVVGIMDTIKQVGIERLGMVTEPSPPRKRI